MSFKKLFLLFYMVLWATRVQTSSVLTMKDEPKGIFFPLSLCLDNKRERRKRSRIQTKKIYLEKELKEIYKLLEI